jgi:hypothetical protein
MCHRVGIKHSTPPVADEATLLLAELGRWRMRADADKAVAHRNLIILYPIRTPPALPAGGVFYSRSIAPLVSTFTFANQLSQ